MNTTYSGYMGKNTTPLQPSACWDFDGLALLATTKYFIRTIDNREISKAYEFAQAHISGLASCDKVQQIHAKNRNSIFLLHKDKTIHGVYALLFLNPLGLEGLLLNEIDPSKIAIDYIAAEKEKPAAIYKWAVAAPGIGLEAFKCMSKVLHQDKFQSANLFLRAMTEAGKLTSRKLGFTPISSKDKYLQRYVRHANRSPNLSQAA
jgi:hypothetical protein